MPGKHVISTTITESWAFPQSQSLFYPIPIFQNILYLNCNKDFAFKAAEIHSEVTHCNQASGIVGCTWAEYSEPKRCWKSGTWLCHFLLTWPWNHSSFLSTLGIFWNTNDCFSNSVLLCVCCPHTWKCPSGETHSQIFSSVFALLTKA